MSEKDFTRNRKQSFSGTVLFMINFLTKSLSLEIINFVGHLKEKPGTAQDVFTKSAFVQTRKKISPEVFRYLINRLRDEFYTDNANVALILEEFRVLSVDGSRIILPMTKELEVLYGKTKNQTDTFIYDRGYPSYDFIHEHHQKNIAFLMRVKPDFSSATNVFIQSGKTSQSVEIYPGKNMNLKGKAYDKNTPLCHTGL